MARSDSTAIGNANCSPRKSLTNLTAADFSAALQAPQHAQEFAPGRQNALAGQHLAKNHAIAAQEHVANGFEGAVPVGSLSGGRLGVEQRPSPAAVTRAGGASRTVSGAAFGIDQRAQIIETIRGNQTGGDQFPEAGFDFGLEPPRAAHNVGEKRSSTFAQKCVYLARRSTQAKTLVTGIIVTARGHPIGVIAHEKGDRGDAAWESRGVRQK